MNIDYTLWPNADGVLGEIKTPIPDGATVQWPEGDALVGNFVYKDGLISAFVDTKALVINESKTTTFPYDYVNIHLDSILEDEMNIEGGAKPEYLIVSFGTGNSGDTIVLGTKYINCVNLNDVKAIEQNYKTVDIIDGVWNESLENYVGDSSSSSNQDAGMFCYSDIVTFNSNLNSLEYGGYMFCGCSYLTSFEVPLPNLKRGANMFSYFHRSNILDDREARACTSLTSFKSKLPKMTIGDFMFCGCGSLTTFESELPELSSATRMFGAHTPTGFGTSSFSAQACPITTFNIDVPKLSSARSMFYACNTLTSFNGNLSSLKNGQEMFYGCSSLTSFNGNLSSLTNGQDMFRGCYLDTQSVKNISETINTITSRSEINIGIGGRTPSDEERLYFTEISNRGWLTLVNGSAYNPMQPASVMTLDENEQEIEIPIPFYAKSIASNEENASHVDENGNFFRILGAQFIYGDDLSTYAMFTCEADAAAQMRLTPYIKEETENLEEAI